jgi:pimeloyl-ACP methyl ester carboxylesterase
LLASILATGIQAFLVHRRARDAERAHPPEGRFVEIDGVRLHYVERGEGSPVVLLHGNGAMIQDFDISGTLDVAADRYRVVAFDRPGFGHTDRPRGRIWTPAAQAKLLREAFNRLGIARPLLVGHSWGTLVALALAFEYPSEISGLVLVSGYYFPTARADVALFSPTTIPLLGDLTRYTISPPLGRLLAPKIFRKIFAPARITTRFAEEFPTELALRPSQIRATAEDTALMIPAAAFFAPRYRSLLLPVIVIAGSGDQIVDLERQSRRLHRELPNSELLVVEGGGHMIHHTAPHRIIEALHTAAARIAEVSLDASVSRKWSAAPLAVEADAGAREPA